MKASTKTLQSFVNLLPLVLSKRYGPEFAIGAANEVLAEIEQAADPDLLVRESGLLILENITDYVLPANVRVIRGVYGVIAGEVVPDKDHPVKHEVQGNKLRLLELPTVSENEDISGTVAAGAPADKAMVFDDTVGKIDASVFDDDELISRLVRVTHASGTVEYRILAGNTVDDTVVDINGELDALALAGDTYLITDNFFILEHNGYLTRLTGATNLAQLIDIPQDFEKVFRAGLTYKYYLQADSLSKECDKWEKTFADQLQIFCIDTTKARGTSTRNQPRSLPSFF